MSCLPIDHPEVHQQFMHGGFSVQLGSQNPYGRIPVDQTIEETVNRDTQTAGGTKGFSLKQAAVEMYYLTSGAIAMGTRQWRWDTEKDKQSCSGQGLEKQVLPAETIPGLSATIIDGMSLVQKMKGNDQTFSQRAASALTQILHEGARSQRIDVVFDQWRKFLSSSANKANLIRFLVAEWKTPKLRDRLSDKQLYVASEESCLHITKDQWAEVASLQSNQEEADTRMILNAAHAAEEGYSAVVVTADDTDVLLLCLAFYADISCPLFQNCGTKNRVRYLDITKLRQALGDCVCNAVIGMYAYTGCDTLSAFAGRGKLRALKLIMRSEHFQEVFRKLGHVGSSSLASCHHASLQEHLHILSPVEHGWARNDDGQLTVEWMRGSPASEAVLQLLSCNCSHRCKLLECQCMSSGLKCTNLCKLQTCDNQPQEEGLGMMITAADLTDSETGD
ncbi:hypothetical protein AAFF_G00121660 [Aldrovandia affinis]|uniref:Tesmin/TSO1-like CXC domain-containing protein n=1 Tax=Aldrovandia affinis TaxID=143900 RepID=A0AAD7RUM6_9TELE|nr:hypothetical protein AAFF_G00121660 [Aldrovandia affinis]